MKKLIAILMVMAIVAGFAFADAPAVNDAAKLTVNTEVKIQYPNYSLQATDWVAGGAGDNASLGAAAVVATTPGTSTIRIGDDVLLTTDTTVKFTITQTTLSRIKGVYTLGVEATNLEITKVTKSDGTKADATAEEKAANFFEVSSAPTITKGASGTEPTNTSMVNTTAGSLAITYNGKKVAQNDVIGTFNYTWTANENNAAGDYQATVMLKITSIT